MYNLAGPGKLVKTIVFFNGFKLIYIGDEVSSCCVNFAFLGFIYGTRHYLIFRLSWEL